MPNWCDTSYKCVGNPKEIKSLYDALNHINNLETSLLENGFGKLWLGNLIHQLGGNWETYRCRGEITDYSLDGNVLTINQSTAWCEQEGVRRFIEEKFPSVKVYYLEQESGCGVFHTNDAGGLYFPERYFLDTGGDCEYFETLEQASEYVSEMIGYRIPPSEYKIIQALDRYTEIHCYEGICCAFHAFAIVD